MQERVGVGSAAATPPRQRVQGRHTHRCHQCRPASTSVLRWRLQRSPAGLHDAQRSAPLGPEPPPEWLKRLEEAANDDVDVAHLLEGSDSDPRVVEERIRARFTERRDDIMRTPTGADEPMRVVFRDVDPWNLWIWAQVRSNLLEDERETLSEVLKAWFILGKLGAFSSSNMQVQRHADRALSVSGMQYRLEERDTQACVFHAMGDPEFRDNWMRCWFDLGTADEVALDALINTLTTFSIECVRTYNSDAFDARPERPIIRRHTPIVQLVIGGVNADWAEGVEEPKRLQMQDMGAGMPSAR